MLAPVTFVAAVWIRRNRGITKARRMASSDPMMFDRLWEEGALSLRLAGSEHICMSPGGDYTRFVWRHFLYSGPTPDGDSLDIVLDDAMLHDD